MCGRYALTSTPDAVRALLGYDDQPNFPPRFNIAPTQPVAIAIRSEGPQRRFALMRWGFLPSWLKDPADFPLVFNIRSETAAEKPAFRNAILRRRGIMPADAFYEWRKAGKERVPYLIRRVDRRPFGFAAMWETFSASDGSEIDTAAIITTAAVDVFAMIHPRSPAILDESDYERWLDPATPLATAHACLTPAQPDLFETVPIGPAINKVANDAPSVQEPMSPDQPGAAVAKPARPARSARPTSGGPDDSGQGSLF